MQNRRDETNVSLDYFWATRDGFCFSGLLCVIIIMNRTVYYYFPLPSSLVTLRQHDTVTL